MSDFYHSKRKYFICICTSILSFVYFFCYSTHRFCFSSSEKKTMKVSWTFENNTQEIQDKSLGLVRQLCFIVFICSLFPIMLSSCFRFFPFVHSFIRWIHAFRNRNSQFDGQIHIVDYNHLSTWIHTWFFVLLLL